MAAIDTTDGPHSIRAPLITFLALAFPLSWYPWVLALLQHRTTGPNPLGVFLAALITAGIFARWRGARDLLLGLVRFRAPLLVWAVAILVPVAAVGASCAIAMQQGVTFQSQPIPWSDLLDRFVFTFLFVALGEEPGWRGTLLPLLQRRFHPLVATLVLCPIWAIWHLPLMGSEFAWPLVPAFLVSLVGGAIVLSWIYNASKGSIVLPMIMHALLNTVGAGFAYRLIAPEALPSLWWSNAAVWTAVGVIAVVATQGRLGVASGSSDPERWNTKLSARA